MDVQQWTGLLSDALTGVAQGVLEYLPNIIGSLALLILGWIIARVLASIIRNIIARGLQRLAQTKRLQTKIEQSQAYRSTPLVISRIVYWTVLLFFLAASIEALGLPAVSNALSLVTTYLPRILVGVIIVLAGLWAGELLRTALARAATRAGIAQGELLGRGAQVFVVFVAIIIATDQIGIDSTVLITTLVTVFAATFGAIALAFGLGATVTVSNIIAAHYVRKAYRSGDSINIGDVEGQIIEITHTAVLLETGNGRVMVPTRRFSEEVSILRPQGK